MCQLYGICQNTVNSESVNENINTDKDYYVIFRWKACTSIEGADPQTKAKRGVCCKTLMFLDCCFVPAYISFKEKLEMFHVYICVHI